jgi:hypothetical protein
MSEVTADTTKSPQLYIPYSSWDNEQFWIGQEVFGRDFPEGREAEDYGAVFVSKQQFSAAYTLYKEKGALTYEEVRG